MSVSSLTYDNMYRVTGKSQHLSQTGVQFDGTLSAGYDLKYTYSGEEGKRFQLAGVDDVNYSAETVTEESKVVNAHAYEYDANGNLVFVNTSRTKKDGQMTPNAGERKLKWDEENRLTASDDNGFVTSYWYDASGERTVKSSGENAAMFVNAEFAGGTTNTAKFSLYVSPYLVANQGGRYTKHIYIGSQRIVSKLGDMKSYGADPRRIEYAGSESDGPKVDYKTKYALQQQVIKDNFAHFDVPYNGTDNNDYVDGKGFSEKDGSLKSAMLKAAMAKEGNKSAGLKDNFQQSDSYEQYQYFYHPDHLGSSSFITNTEGEVVQHIEYVPYGEVFIEERNNVWNTPYLFNAKEFDEETGLYYYGARYYDPRLAIFYTTDRYAEKYPWQSAYSYAGGNPIKFIDVNGDSLTIVHNIGFLGLGGKETLTYKDGNLYNANGNKYSGRVNGFLKSVMGALKSLADTDEGTSLISELQKSTNTFTIMSGDNAFVPTSPNKAGANLSEVQAVTGNTDGSTGAGGIIYWNANSTSGGLNLNGNTYRPSYIGLGHEMGHASDSNQGLLHFSNDYTNPLTGETYVSTYNGLLKSEWRAVYRENIIRSQAKLPLRTHYGYDITSGTPQPTGPRLLDSSNKPINYQ